MPIEVTGLANAFLQRVTGFLSNSSDWTIFLWVYSQSLLTGVSDYKCCVNVQQGPTVYVGINFAFGNGVDSNKLLITTNTGSTVGTLVLVNSWHAIALKYNSTTHVLTLSVDGGAFTTTQSYSLAAFTTTDIYLGDDRLGSGNLKKNLVVAYYREWQEQVSDANLLTEMKFPIAIRTTNLHYDAQLEILTDLSDRQGNSSFFVGGTGLDSYRFGTPLVQSALVTDINIIALPETVDVFSYHFNTTINYPLYFCNNVQTGLTQLGMNGCPTSDNGYYVIYETSSPTVSTLVKFDNLGNQISTKVLSILIGERNGYHSLMQLPNGHLLTVNRSSHAVIELDPVSGSVVKTYSLTINPFDGCVNSFGTRLVYVDGNHLKVWDLANDSLILDLKDFGTTIHFPIWLDDCSILVFEGTYGGSGNIVRINTSGTVLNTYTFSPFTSGVYGIAASTTFGFLFVYGHNSTLGQILIISLSTGTSLNLIPLNNETVVGDSSAFFMVFKTSFCTAGISDFSGIYFLSPGKTHDTLNSVNGSPVDQAIPNPFAILSLVED